MAKKTGPVMSLRFSIEIRVEQCHHDGPQSDASTQPRMQAKLALPHLIYEVLLQEALSFVPAASLGGHSDPRPAPVAPAFHTENRSYHSRYPGNQRPTTSRPSTQSLDRLIYDTPSYSNNEEDPIRTPLSSGSFCLPLLGLNWSATSICSFFFPLLLIRPTFLLLPFLPF